MIEVTKMVTEKGTGIRIQNHEPLVEATTETKLRNQAQGLTGLLPMRAGLIDHGMHTEMTHFIRTSRKMVHCIVTLVRVVHRISVMACILCQL